MKLPTPSAPFSPVYVHGESITIETEGKVLVLPSGNPDILLSHNEYTLNSNRLTIAESPFGGLKGSGSPDYAPGTVNIIEGDGVYLQDVNGQNSSKTLSAGKLKELGLLSVDTVNHTITEEFIIKNDSTANNPLVIDNCDSLGSAPNNWVVHYDDTGRGTLSIDTTDYTTSTGCVKMTCTTAGSIFAVRSYSPTINISTASFLCFDIKAPAGKSGAVYLFCPDVNNRIVKLLTYTGNWQRFVIPINTMSSYGTPNLSTIGQVRFDLIVAEVGQTLQVDNITADVARPATLEIQVPDYLADSSAQIYTHNGSAYQLCRTCKLDSTYASVSDTDANCTLADGTKFSDVYGTGNGRSVFPKGESGQSKNGSLAGSSITYSQNKGTLKRIGLRVDLPPAGTAAPNFSACRIKIVMYYAPDTSGKYSATYQFSDDTNASTGLRNLSKPWLALYDPAKTEIDFFLHTYRPRLLEYKKDENGTIHELKLFPGNGQLYHGRITFANPHAVIFTEGFLVNEYFSSDFFDSSYFSLSYATEDTRIFSTSHPGSITNFLQGHWMVTE